MMEVFLNSIYDLMSRFFEEVNRARVDVLLARIGAIEDEIFRRRAVKEQRDAAYRQQRAAQNAAKAEEAAQAQATAASSASQDADANKTAAASLKQQLLTKRKADELTDSELMPPPKIQASDGNVDLDITAVGTDESDQAANVQSPVATESTASSPTASPQLQPDLDVEPEDLEDDELATAAVELKEIIKETLHKRSEHTDVVDHVRLGETG